FSQKDKKYDEQSRERNGWGVIEEEIPEQWPLYTTQTVMDLHKLDFDQYKEEEKKDPYILMSEQQKQQLKDFLAANQNIFAKEIKDLRRTSVVSHAIDTGNSVPIKQ